MYFATLEKYRSYLDEWTHAGQSYDIKPLSRYDTIEYALANFANNVGRNIVELGTIRSFCHGGIKGCNTSDKAAWHPTHPADWDWGAGFFSRVAAESLQSVGAQYTIHTVDVSAEHLNRCKLVCHQYLRSFRFHNCDSVKYLENYVGKIDLLYMDTGDMNPLEPSAQLSLAEAQVVLERNLISNDGCIVIDDVQSTIGRECGDKSEFGKGKYSLPLYLENGFDIMIDGFQTVLKRR
jgi:hypothetical protein